MFVPLASVAITLACKSCGHTSPRLVAIGFAIPDADVPTITIAESNVSGSSVRL